MKIFLVCISVLFSFIVGCSKNADPFTTKNPYTKLTVTYDAMTNKSTGKVYLYQGSAGGKLVILDKDEQLTLNDRAMQYQSSDGSYLVILDSYVPPYVFTLVDLKKNKFVNTISENRISFPVDAQYNGDTVNTTFPLIFKWSGVPTDTNETISVTINGKKYTQDTLASTSIVIPETELALYKGKSILTMLERYKELKLQQKPGSDGFISMLYEAQPRTLIFREGSAPLTNKNVYTEFTVVHDDATNISTGSAQFWDGSKAGANLFIDATSILQFQTTALVKESGTNRYSNTIVGYLPTYQFRFVDINKKEFINTITGNRISLSAVLQNNGDTVNSAIPLQISWNEAGVDTSEKVTMRISSKSFVQDTLGKKNITIPASELAVYAGTTQQVFIERMKETPLQQKLGTSGSISNRYIAPPKTIYFK